MTLQEKVLVQTHLSESFRPGAPINSKDLFSGRTKQISDIIDATFQLGQHIVVFGERGVGKTSLATTLGDLLKGAGVTHLTSGVVNCDGTDDFSSLWRKVFRELKVIVKTTKPGFGQGTEEALVELDGALPDAITPDDVRIVISQAIELTPNCAHMVIVFDEVDRLKKRAVTSLLCDTIKTLSDHLVRVTIMLVGVADAIDSLIAEHRSIERSLVQVAMPRMSRPELEELISNGFAKSGMTISEDATEYIVRLSHGLPHFAHLLSLESGKAALNEYRLALTTIDVLTATVSAVSKSHSHLSAYIKATRSTQSNNLYREVLLACVLANKDDLGWFNSREVVTPLSRLLKRTCNIPHFARHLNEFCGDARGTILQKSVSQRQHRYRFVNPLLEPFITIHSVSTKLISNTDLLPG